MTGLSGSVGSLWRFSQQSAQASPQSCHKVPTPLPARAPGGRSRRCLRRHPVTSTVGAVGAVGAVGVVGRARGPAGATPKTPAHCGPTIRGMGSLMTPSPRLWRMRFIEVAIVTVLAAAVVAVGVGDVLLSPLAAAVVVVVGALSLVFVRRRFRAWAYEERDEDLVVSRGVMFRRQSVVPYGRMQFVDVTAGPIERSFSLATVRLHTAAAASDARIPGLEREEAARLRDRLAALGEAKAAGL